MTDVYWPLSNVLEISTANFTVAIIGGICLADSDVCLRQHGNEACVLE